MTMAVDIEDDELEQEEEDKDKSRPKPQAIGNPIAPAPASTGDSGRFQDVRPIMPQPAQTTQPTPIMAGTAPPQAPVGGASIGAPINPYVPAPRPRAEALTQGMEPGGRLTTPSYELPSTDPNYQHHPVEKFFDRLAGAFPIGQSIEAAGGFGTIGHDINRIRAEKEAANENATIQEAQKERQGEATIGETGARTAETEANAKAKEAGMENVMITLPNGETVTIPQSQLGPDVRALITQQGAGQRTAATNESREGIASEANKTKEDIAAGKPQPTKVLVVNGKSHVMERDPKTGEYSIDRGEAPPNYAQVAPDLRTVTVIDPDTQLPITRTLGGKVEGVSGTGAYAHQMEQAGAVNRMAEHVIQSFEANRNQVGTLAAWVKKYGINTPIGDPKLSEMQAELFSFSSMSPALHQFRAVTAQEAAENILGGLQKNPDATIAALRVIGETTARAINPNIKTGGEEKGNAPNDKSQWQQSNGKYRYSNDGGKTWHNFTQP